MVVTAINLTSTELPRKKKKKSLSSSSKIHLHKSVWITLYPEYFIFACWFTAFWLFVLTFFNSTVMVYLVCFVDNWTFSRFHFLCDLYFLLSRHICFLLLRHIWFWILLWSLSLNCYYGLSCLFLWQLSLNCCYGLYCFPGQFLFLTWSTLMNRLSQKYMYINFKVYFNSLQVALFAVQQLQGKNIQ